MRTLLISAVSALALAGAASAHPATEQYIPIGQSPGGGTVQGTAEAVAAPATAGGPTTIIVERADAPDQSFVLGPNTRIYIDRSAQRLPSLIGRPEDVQPGRVIEVRLADPATRVAAWVKVRP